MTPEQIHNAAITQALAAYKLGYGAIAALKIPEPTLIETESQEVEIVANSGSDV